MRNIVLTLVTGLLLINTSFADIDSNLVGYWKLDDCNGTAAVDSSGNNNNGTLINGPVWVKENVNLALRFDGINDYVNINDSPSLQFGSGDFTVAVWIKFPINGSEIGGGIVNKGLQSYGIPHVWGLERYGSSTNQVLFVVKSDAGPDAVSNIANPLSLKDLQEGKGITFQSKSDTPGGAVIIYTISGKLVKKLTIPGQEYKVQWDGKNEDGEKVTRGIYIYKIGDSVAGKLAIK